MSSQTRQCISTIEKHLHEVEQERDHALREREVALNDVKNLVQQRDSARTEILQLNMEIAALTRTNQLPRVGRLILDGIQRTEGLRRAQLANVLRPMAMDPATLDAKYNPDDFFNEEWSSEIVDALKTLYKEKPRWTIVTTLEEDILVRLTHEKQTNRPSCRVGDDGNSYSYQSIVGYFL